MEKSIYAHVKAIPTRFPDIVTRYYRCANPRDNTFTGEAYDADLPWAKIRRSFIMTVPELDEREGYLRNGEAANMGLGHHRGKFPSTESVTAGSTLNPSLEGAHG